MFNTSDEGRNNGRLDRWIFNPISSVITYFTTSIKMVGRVLVQYIPAFIAFFVTAPLLVIVRVAAVLVAGAVGLVVFMLPMVPTAETVEGMWKKWSEGSGGIIPAKPLDPIHFKDGTIGVIEWIMQNKNPIEHAKSDFLALQHTTDKGIAGVNGFVVGALASPVPVVAYVVAGFVPLSPRSVLNGLWKAVTFPFRYAVKEAMMVDKEVGVSTFEKLKAFGMHDVDKIMNKQYDLWDIPPALNSVDQRHPPLQQNATPSTARSHVATNTHTHAASSTASSTAPSTASPAASSTASSTLHPSASKQHHLGAMADPPPSRNAEAIKAATEALDKATADLAASTAQVVKLEAEYQVLTGNLPP